VDQTSALPSGGLAQESLGRNEMESANHHAGLSVTRVTFQPGDAKVDYLDVSIRQHHDIRRLDVPMDNSLLMRITQAKADLANNFELLDQRKLSSGRIRFSSESPGKYSITMYGLPSCSPKS